MTDTELTKAQRQREELLLSDEIDARITLLFSHSDVSSEARSNLRALLKHYAKEAHPFRACVRDNMKRFGPGRTERVCATVKDMIRGTHRWREVQTSDLAPEITTEIEQLLMSIDEEALDNLMMEVATNG